MSDFIDLKGASGATYRFRSWADAGQTPMAGNFVVVEGAARPGRMIMAGVIGDLSKAPNAAREAGAAGESVFVRLNVSRLTRSSEHEDLVAKHQPPSVYAAD